MHKEPGMPFLFVLRDAIQTIVPLTLEIMDGF